jgi:hypothetical protein
MSTFFWIAGIVIALPALWFLLKIALTYVVPPEKSGREYLKQKLKSYDIDPGLLPDAALNEIVANSILVAKTMSTVTDLPEYANWRAGLVRNLDGEAVIIAEIMEDSKSSLAVGRTRDVLVKFGVVKARQI